MPLPAPPHRLCAHLTNTSLASLATTSLPYSQSALGITSVLLRHGLVSSLSLGGPTHASPSTFPSLPPPARRLWVNLKYRNGQPVLRRINLVSKASLRKIVTKDELGRLLMSKRARNVGGAGMGEVFVVRVDKDKEAGREGAGVYLEGWEAYRQGLGGEVVCRAS
ncbi:hypothetical protein Q5752_001681 [Cryptotrichosporon argae]